VVPVLKEQRILEKAINDLQKLSEHLVEKEQKAVKYSDIHKQYELNKRIAMISYVSSSINSIYYNLS
jgi:hypothetical protein